MGGRWKEEEEKEEEEEGEEKERREEKRGEEWGGERRWTRLGVWWNRPLNLNYLGV